MKKVKLKFWIVALLVIAFSITCSQQNDSRYEADICIYGATPSGITAAMAAAEEGHKVIVVEPSRWAGGMLGAGLKPMQDCPNFEAVGGISRHLLRTLGMSDGDGEIDYKASRQDVLRVTRSTMSPKTLRDDFRQLLEESGVKVIYEHRISEVKKSGGKIKEVFFDLAPPNHTGVPIPYAVTENNLSVRAKLFIDASYEGDLMAEAGVEFRIGRESSEEFGESLAGVRPAIHTIPIDPYIIPGDESSGLLPMIVEDHGKEVGSADEYTQAYNYRFYITDEPEHRAEIKRPENYNAEDFELLGRYVEYLIANKPAERLDTYLGYIFPGWRNSNDYNYERRSPITTAPLSISQEYAVGDYAKKAEIWEYHQYYLAGIYTFLTTDERVPRDFREKTAKIGFDKRHFPETDGWPQQLYVRVTRRMVGNYTVTQDDVYNNRKVEDPVGLAQYGIDTYPSRRYALKKDGNTYLAVEGNMFIGGSVGPTQTPYQISYNAIVPKKEVCTNLIVPVCFSATHVGYASARMEPVFMVLGESAGIAASHALKENVSVQDIDMEVYLDKLREREQRLDWPVE